MKFTKLTLVFGLISLGFVTFNGQANAVEVSHKVKFGDTLSGISLKYFGDPNRVEELAKKNKIENPDLILAGDTITLDTETGEIEKEVAAIQPTVQEVKPTPEVVEAEPIQEAVAQEEVAQTATYTSGSVQDIVRQAAASRGWDTGANWEAIDFIVQHESSWNPNAKNPSSTAFGLFQMLVETHSNPAVQAENGMNYIAGRYGTPSNALAFWQVHRWY